ncbi:hypothetical protein IFR05_010136, partial [Cadophora sp. M221]
MEAANKAFSGWLLAWQQVTMDGPSLMLLAASAAAGMPGHIHHIHPVCSPVLAGYWADA